MSILECQGLVVGYGGNGILPPIDLTVREGEFVLVLGRNGAGKTTFFRTVIGLLPAIKGRMNAAAGKLPIAYIGQRMGLEQVLPLSTRDVVAMGLDRGQSFLKPFVTPSKRALVEATLAFVDAAHLAHRRFGDLSEGEKQRVLIARLLASQPRLAILDEPTAAMDQVAEQHTLELVKRLCQERKMGVLVVSHQWDVVAKQADRVLFLDRASQTVKVDDMAGIAENKMFQANFGSA